MEKDATVHLLASSIVVVLFSLYKNNVLLHHWETLQKRYFCVMVTQ